MKASSDVNILTGFRKKNPLWFGDRNFPVGSAHCRFTFWWEKLNVATVAKDQFMYLFIYLHQIPSNSNIEL